MNSSWRRVLYQLGLALGSIIFLCQTWNGYQAIQQNTIQVPFPAILAVAWGLAVLALGLQIISWSYLMRALGVYLSWRQVFKGYTISFLPRYIPGSIWGYLSRSQWLRSHDVPYVVSNTGSILELLTAVTTNGLVIGICYAWVSRDPLLFTSWVVLAILVPLAIWIILRQVPNGPFLRFFGNKAMKKNHFVMPLHSWLRILMLYVLLWFCYGGAFLLIFSAFNFPWTVGILETTLWFSIAWFVGFLVVFVPTGLGVRELALSSLVMMNLGLLPSQAGALAVACRFITFLAEFAWVIVGVTRGKGGAADYGLSNSSSTRFQSDELLGGRKDCFNQPG